MCGPVQTCAGWRSRTAAPCCDVFHRKVRIKSSGPIDWSSPAFRPVIWLFDVGRVPLGQSVAATDRAGKLQTEQGANACFEVTVALTPSRGWMGTGPAGLVAALQAGMLAKGQAVLCGTTGHEGEGRGRGEYPHLSPHLFPTSFPSQQPTSHMIRTLQPSAPGSGTADRHTKQKWAAAILEKYRGRVSVRMTNGSMSMD